MKLFAPTYIHPDRQRGTFTNVTFEDVATKATINNYAETDFEMSYTDADGKRVVIERYQLKFDGLTADIDSPGVHTSNIPSRAQKINPAYDPNYQYNESDSELDKLKAKEYLVMNLEECIVTYGFDPSKVDTNPLMDGWGVLRFGYPTFDKMQHLVDVGIDSPSITLPTDPVWNWFAKGFIKENIKIKNEPIGLQFDFIEE